MAPEEKMQFQMMMLQNRDEMRREFDLWKAQNIPNTAQQGQIFQQPDGSFVRVTPQGVAPIPGLQPGAHKPGGTGGAGGMAPVPQVPDKWEGMPDKAPPGIRQDVWDASIRYVKTGTMPPLGNRSEMRQQILAAEPAARQALGVSTTDAPENALKFKRLQTVESAFGKGQQANNMISLNTVADHLALMREYADALNNNDIPAANAVLNRLNKEAGYSNVTNFDTARDIMADEVVRLLTSTGGTEADRAGMQQRFASSGSPAQIVGALDVAQNFVIGRFNALQQQYAGNDKKRQDFFQNDMMTAQAKRMFAQHGQQQAPAARVWGNGGTVYTDDGEHWFNKDGTPYVPKQ